MNVRQRLFDCAQDVFLQKYINLCFEDEDLCLTGLERHEGEQLMTELQCLGELIL